MSLETRTAEQLAAQMLRRMTTKRIEMLHSMAENLEHEAMRNIDRAELGNGLYSTAVNDVINMVMNGMAGLHLEVLVSTAVDADIAHAKG